MDMLYVVCVCDVLDIYVELFEVGWCICFCIDGVLYEYVCLLLYLCDVFVMWIKVFLCMDIVEWWFL